MSAPKHVAATVEQVSALYDGLSLQERFALYDGLTADIRARRDRDIGDADVTRLIQEIAAAPTQEDAAIALDEWSWLLCQFWQWGGGEAALEQINDLLAEKSTG